MKKENLDIFVNASLNKKDIKNYAEVAGFRDDEIIERMGVNAPFEILIKDTDINNEIVGIYNLKMNGGEMTTIESDGPIFNKKTISGNNANPLFVTNNKFQALRILESGHPAIAIDDNNVDVLLELIKNTKNYASPVIVFANMPELESKLSEMVIWKSKAINEEKSTLNVISNVTAINTVNNYMSESGLDSDEFDKDIFEVATDVLDRKARGENYLGQWSLEPKYKESIKNGSGVPIKTGIDIIDGVLGGLYKNRLLLLGGETSAGKTTIALNIMRNLSKANMEVHYVSLETSGEEIRNRTLSLETTHSFQNVVDASINDLMSLEDIGNVETLDDLDCKKSEVLEKAMRNYKKFANNLSVHAGGVVASSAITNTATEVAAGLGITMVKIRALVSEAVSRGIIPILLVDYIQMLKGSRDNASSIEKDDEVVMFLKVLAVEYNIPVIALSSINKISSNKTPSDSVFKGSNSLTYTSDVAAILHFNLTEEDWKGGKKTDDNDRSNAVLRAKARPVRNLLLTITKNRIGKSGYSLPLAFVSKTGFISDYLTVKDMGFPILDEDFQDAVEKMKLIPGNNVSLV